MFSKIDYLTEKKTNNLIEKTKLKHHKVLFLLMLDAGLRVSEACSLKVKNFEFKSRLIKVKCAKKKKEKFREIPISDRLYQALADHLTDKKIKDPESWLFPSEQSVTGHISRISAWTALDKFRKNNPGFKNLHPHALRHSFATNLIAKDTHIVHIKELLGHNSLDTTAIYTHIPSEIIKNKIDKSAEKSGLFQKFWLTMFPKRQLGINISSPQENFTVGRKAEISHFQTIIDKEINVIITGDIGSGKSEILKHIPAGRKILRIDDTTRFKETLIQSLLFLYNNDKEVVMNLMFPQYDISNLSQHLSKHSAINLAQLLINATTKKEYILQIDSVDNITPSTVKILEKLKDHFTIITTAREIKMDKSSFLWNFERVELKNLSRSESLELIYRLSYDLEIEDPELFRNHIFEQSAGNPRVVYELIDRYRKEIFVSNDVVRQVKHYGSLAEFDMTIIILVGLAGLAILRYLSMETGESSLRFIGGAALILLLIFRNVFRFTKRKTW
jgi:hypothetical protein